jgi:hypothetical protein
MNELQLIRNQLALERAHASAVANACARVLQSEDPAGPASASLEQFVRACVDYLACVLAWFEERDQRLAELVQARSGAADPPRRAFEEVLGRPGRSREALAKLEAACAATVGTGAVGAAASDAAARQAWREFGEYFNGTWSTRRDALETLLASNTRAGDWRTLGGIDADSILEERRRYALVAAQAPPGVHFGTGAEPA